MDINASTIACTTQARKKFAKGEDCDCNECMKNYKTITRRWKTQKKLQIWFSAMSDDERVQWYKKEKVKSSKLTIAEKRAERLKLKVSTRTIQRRAKKNSNRI